MFSNNKMEADQANRCVQRYSFLCPRFNSLISNYSQRTRCDLASSSVSSMNGKSEQVGHSESSLTSTNRQPVSFFSLFSAWKASCEAKQPSATDRMERAKENLKETPRSGSLISEVDIQNYLAKETGKERLMKMFTKNHRGESSPEFQFIYQVTIQGAAVTFLVTTTLAGRKAKQDFIDRNRATVFKTRFQAFRRLQDTIFLFSMKEGAKWALRVSLFSLTFMGISESIAVYRNKSSVWEYVVASGATMGMLKANRGLKAFVAGSGLGAIAGLFVGLLVLGGMKGLNETQEQRHYWAIHKELERERLFAMQGRIAESPAAETA